MKTFNKTFLPDSIEYNGTQYKLNIEATHKHRDKPIKTSSRYHIQVKVLARNLRGREDFHGQLYKPNVWIFSSELGFMDDKLPRHKIDTRPVAIKELARIKKFGY